MNNLLTAITGALISIMIGFNGELSKSVGNFNATVIIHIVGLLTVIFILLLRRCKVSFRNNISILLYSAGAIGVLTVIFNNISFAELGVSLTIALGLLGQSVSALVIDQFGLFGMKKIGIDSRKLIGLALIALGIIVMTI